MISAGAQVILIGAIVGAVALVFCGNSRQPTQNIIFAHQPTQIAVYNNSLWVVPACPAANLCVTADYGHVGVDKVFPVSTTR